MNEKEFKMIEDKYKNKYKIETIRLKDWDYTKDGIYFITIKTKNNVNYFGEIKDFIMIQNELGKIAEKYWLEIPKHFSNVKTDDFIIMPNHIHGILIIENNNTKQDYLNDNDTNNLENSNDLIKDILISEKDIAITSKDVAMQRLYSYNETENFYSKISPKPKSLSTIIRSYKSICTKTINSFQSDIYFSWHSRFYERIIRDEIEFENVKKYIINNPKNQEDNSS